MSTKLTTHQALQKIAEEYDAPIFFDRLKQHGIVSQNDAESAELLKLATFVDKQIQEKQVEEQSELSQLIVRAIQRARDNYTQHHLLVVASKAFAETLHEDSELRNAFAIGAHGIVQTG